MAPFSRFQASPYKNALPIPSPPTSHYFPHLSSQPTAVAASEDAIFVASGSEITVLRWEDQDKGSVKEHRSWNPAVGDINDLRVQGGVWLSVSGRTSTIIYELPSPSEVPSKVLLSLPAGSVSPHPTTPSLLLLDLSIYSLDSDKPAIVLEPWTAKGVWSTCWSWDGPFVCGVGKDGTIGVWNPRQGTSVVGRTDVVLNPLKAGTCTPFGAYFLITGFSKSRERVVLLVDPRSPVKPVATSVLDYETSPLLPVVDQERGIVYLSGKGDSILKYSEFTQNKFTWSAVGLGTSVESLTLASWRKLDVIQGEINRIIVLAKSGEVVPVPVIAPQRFYIDFNESTNPPVRADGDQTAQQWLAGGDALPATLSRDPARRQERKTVAPSDEASAVSSTNGAQTPTPVATKPITEQLRSVSLSSSSDTAPAVKESTAAPTGDQVKPQSALSSAPAPVASATSPTTLLTPAPAAQISTTPAAATPAAAPSKLAPKPSTKTSSAPSQPLPRWSRNFLAGSTPLITAHDNLDYVSSSYPAEFPLLLATSELLLFPVSGPGGRIAVHERTSKGRMPLVGDVRTIEVGTELVDWTLDPLEVDGGLDVVTAGKDGKLRVWRVPKDGLKEVLHEPTKILDAPGLDKVVKVVFSPTVKHLLAVVSNDAGEGFVRVIDTASGQTILKEKINDEGVFAAAWSRSGTLLAVACKDRKLRVLDPRQPSKVYITSAFDSPRSFQVEWTNDHQIICVGHTSGSMRKLQLFTLDKDVLSTGGSLSLDVSPALLFPHFDPDTALLWLWCKGSSTITSFDIHVENTKQPFAAVPPFIGGNLQNGVVFLPKTTVDVRGVEVMKALRLTAREVQEISWKVPRRHVERFQDDVFPPTQGPPSASVEAWQKGEEVAVVHVDLQPEGMETLSSMPKAQGPVLKEKPKSGVREETTAERAEKSMALLFEKAQMDLDSDEEARIKGDEEWSD